MKHQASPSSTGSTNTPPQTGYRVWHMLIAVPAIAVVLQLALGSLPPLPKEHAPQRLAATAIAAPLGPKPAGDPNPIERYQRLPDSKIEVLPFNLRGEMTGPLLASIIQDYFPQSTTEQASDLRDTLPPGSNPRMIVIVPEEQEPEKPVF